MPRPFRPLTPAQFAAELASFSFSRRVREVHMHHTWKPRKSDYSGLSTIEGMWRFHTQENGWSDIAQHVSIAPDGTIWTGRDWNRTPASATGHSTGAFMFETIGNFDRGQEKLTGKQRAAVIEVIARVQLKLGLPVESLRFHREFTNQKSCPGNGITRAEILAEVRRRRAEIVGSRELAGTRGGRTAEYDDDVAPASRTRSVLAMNGDATRSAYEDGEPEADLISEYAAAEYAAVEDGEARGDAYAEAERGGDEGEPECGGHAPEYEAPAVHVDSRTGGAMRAVCVGIDAYPPGDELEGCVADARLWAQVLGGLGFQTKLLLDEQATEAGIASALRQLVESGRRGDVLVFQYSGHGTQMVDREGDEDDDADEAVVPVDCDVGGLLLDDEQFAIFKRLAPDASLTCFYDCCNSATIARKALNALLRAPAQAGAHARFMRPTPAMRREYLRRRARGLTAGRGLRNAESLNAAIFSACRDDELALEVNGQGVFTGHATRMLKAAFERRSTNDAFHAQVAAAFPASGTQHPALDGSRAARGRALMRPVTGDSPRPSPDVVELPAETLADLMSRINRMPPEQLRQLLQSVVSGVYGG